MEPILIRIDPEKAIGPVKPVNGVEPFFRFGVTIENFAERGFPPVRILPPKDFAKWGRICAHVIRHRAARNR